MRIIEWLNSNAYRRYPLVDNCDYSMTGPVTTVMTNDVLLDFKCVDYQHNNYSVTFNGFEIVTAVPIIFRASFTLTDAFGSFTFTADVPASAAFPYYVINAVAGQYRVNMWFGAGIVPFTSLTAGVYTFNNPPNILKTLLISQKNCRIISVAGTVDGSVILDDVIFIEEGANISVNLDTANNTIYIGASQGAGSGLSCEVLDNSRKPGEFINTVNGLKPDAFGNINLFAGKGFEIIPDKANHKLIIKITLDTNAIFCGK